MQILTSLPADTKAPKSKLRTALFRLYRPHGKRFTPLLSIFRLHAQFQGSPLVWQQFSSEAPMLSCQPFQGIICISAVLHGTYSTHHRHNPQNTPLPTKCLHRADLQDNDFLVPVTETLEDAQTSSWRTPVLYMMWRHWIKGFSLTSSDVLDSITFKSGPRRWVMYNMGKRKAHFYPENWDIGWDNIMEGLDGLNFTAFI